MVKGGPFWPLNISSLVCRITWLLNYVYFPKVGFKIKFLAISYNWISGKLPPDLDINVEILNKPVKH